MCLVLSEVLDVRVHEAQVPQGGLLSPSPGDEHCLLVPPYLCP